MLDAFSDFIADLAQDARYALRSLSHDRLFVTFAVAIISLGIAAATTVFSVLSPLVLRPLPFDEPERLAWVASGVGGGMSGVTSRTSNLRDFRELSRSFDGLAGYNAFFEEDSYNLVAGDEPERLIGVDVTIDLLDVLRVAPLHGRNFVAEEGVWGGPRAVILSHALWTRRFAADPGIVGTSIALNEAPHEVVGVLPASFDFAEIFTPHTRVDFLKTWPVSDETDRVGNTLSMIGRLAPGATVASTQAELDVIIESLSEADPERWGLLATVSGLQQQISGPHRSGLFLLAAAAAAVMLIVCVNLSNLLLAKGPKRRREMAVRSALGASRGRLIRQLVCESLFVTLGGAVLGAVAAAWLTRVVAASSSVNMPLLESVRVDGSALLFALATAGLAGVGVGIVPALRAAGREAGAGLGRSLRGASTDRGGRRLLEGLVVSEVALACVLLVAGGLLMASFQKLLDVELGFEPAGTMAWQVKTARDFDSVTEASAFYDELTSAISELPGVEVAGLTDAAPLGRNRTWNLGAPGVTYEDDRSWLFAFPHIVDRHYLQAMQIPLLAGRHFLPEDDETVDPVVILNASAARDVYNGEDVLGRVVVSGFTHYRVIGIAADVRHRALDEASDREMYFPMTQSGDYSSLDMVVRSELPEDDLVAAVTAAMRRVDPAMPTADYRTLDDLIARSVSPRRFTLQLLAAFASVALMLAALGIYAVLSSAVSERTFEIGIRMALGETGTQVLRRVVGKTLVLAALGVALGAAGSLAVSRVFESLLYGVEPTEPLAFLGTAAVLLGVAALAGFLPGLRASQTDPTVALRSS